MCVFLRIVFENGQDIVYNNENIEKILNEVGIRELHERTGVTIPVYINDQMSAYNAVADKPFIHERKEIIKDRIVFLSTVDITESVYAQDKAFVIGYMGSNLFSKSYDFVFAYFDRITKEIEIISICCRNII